MPAAAPTFAPYRAITTGSSPNAVAIADLDGDGRNDVVLATRFYFDPPNDYKLFVFFQNPDGTLAAPMKLDGGNGNSVAIGDLDGDGRLDIATSYSDGIGVHFGLGNRAFGPAVRYGPPIQIDQLRVVDVNGDGRADVVAMDWSSGSIAVFYQTAAHALAPTMVPAPHAGWNDMKIADLNGDGRQDIVLVSEQAAGDQRVVVLVQRSDGTLDSPRFVPYAFGPFAPWAVALADVDGDGLRDIVVSQAWNAPESRLIVLRNQALAFTAADVVPSYDIPETMAVADFDGDGLADIAVLHGGWNRAGVYVRRSAGGLDAEVLFPIPYATHYAPQGLAVGDVNGDGRPDIVIADYNNGLVIVYNTTPFAAVIVPPAEVPALSTPALAGLALALAAMALVALRVSVAPRRR